MIDAGKIARDVLLQEASALKQQAESISSDFSDVVQAIFSTAGRVVVSGVGKSGHIGRKIAATLASTGTPASFVHATEASHGDLGMITNSDFCILISNSGETRELADIISHTRRFGIPMAAISSNVNSTLMRAADYILPIVQAPEACPNGLAPTTSTTLTLALGDALSIALMKLRDFKPNDFKIFHPAGKLGENLATVNMLMRPKTEMAILASNVSMQDLVLRMTETGYGLAVIIDENAEIFGVISDGDLRRHASSLFNQSPKEIMSKNPVIVSPFDLVATAIKMMQYHKTYTILVADDNKPVGIIRMHDLIKTGLS